MHICKCIVATLYQLLSNALFRVTAINYVRAAVSIHAAETCRVYRCACLWLSCVSYLQHRGAVSSPRALGHPSGFCVQREVGSPPASAVIGRQEMGVWPSVSGLRKWFECRGWWLFKKLVKEMRDLSRWLWPLTMCLCMCMWLNMWR